MRESSDMFFIFIVLYRYLVILGSLVERGGVKRWKLYYGKLYLKGVGFVEFFYLKRICSLEGIFMMFGG